MLWPLVAQSQFRTRLSCFLAPEMLLSNHFIPFSTLIYQIAIWHYFRVELAPHRHVLLWCRYHVAIGG